MKFILGTILTFITINAFASTVNSINYEGLYHISKPVATRMLSFEVGDDIDEKIIDKEIQKYYKQGYFKDVWADFDNGKLTFVFQERAIISQVELKGYKDDDNEVKDSIIQLKRGTLYSEKKVESAKKRLKSVLNRDGKIDSVVEVKVENINENSVKITFYVNEGKEIIITNLSYLGVKGVDSDEFDDVIANKEVEFMGWFWGQNNGEMKLADLAYDPLRIRDHYMKYGYLDAKVENPFVRVNFDNYTADMSYQIEEGEAYTISDIIVEQSTNVMSDSKIKNMIHLRKGEVFNIETFRKDATKIKKIIADKSYAFVQVVPDLKKNKEKKTVDVIYKVMPGKKVHIRDVVISGNTRTLDRIIRRELYLGAGDMYSLTDLEDSKNALGRLGYFENNTIEEKRVDEETMDLVVKVTEAATGNIQVGAGYGSYGGILVNLAINDSNVFGSGINVGLKAEKSEMTSNYSFDISNPRLNDSDFSGSFGVGISSHTYDDYTVDSKRISIGTGHRLTRYLSAYLGYSWSDNAYSDISDDTDLDDYETYFESYVKSSLSLSFKYDSTDDYYLPRKGFAITQSFEYAGIGGDAQFFKSRSSFNAYKGLQEYLGFDMIARYKARYNYVLDNGYLPIAERFYMGGMGSVRGYESNSLSPTINQSGIDRKIGGTSTFSNNIELSMPLVPKAKMRLLVFADAGYIDGDRPETKSADGTYEERGDFRAGAGLGIEWFSPVGPIQLIYAQPINAQADDVESNFEFSMGQRF